MDTRFVTEPLLAVACVVGVEVAAEAAVDVSIAVVVLATAAVTGVDAFATAGVSDAEVVVANDEGVAVSFFAAEVFGAALLAADVVGVATAEVVAAVA